MKKIKKIMSALLTLCIGFSLMISTTACNVTENVEGAFKITTPEVNNLKVQLTSNDMVTSENYIERYLTATVSPATSYNQEVDWSVAWVNENSTWAKGKTVTDYVEVEPESDGSLSAYVICKQAFGEQINVIVSSRLDSSKRATCVCDYEKRLIGFSKLKIGESELVDGKFYNTKTWKNYAPDSAPIEYEPLFSVGTVDNALLEFGMTVELRFNEVFLEKLENKGIKGNPTFPSSGKYACSKTGDFGLNALNASSYNSTISGQSGKYYDVLNELGEEYEIGFIIIGLKASFSHYFEYPIVLTSEVVNLAVNSVSLNNSGITF